MCKACKFSCDSNEEITKHVTAEHAMLAKNEQYSDYEEENYSSDDNKGKS